MRMMDVDKLNPHPKNSYFFDDIEGEPWVAFLESIETSGVIEPIIVSAPDLTIVSGHQRVRACKKLGIKQVAVEERSYESEDEILKQLIETNIRQRGIGNTNPVKFGRCIAELERIYGIRNGGDRGNQYKVADTTKLGVAKTQKDLADEVGISTEQLRKYKSLTDLIPELQDAVQSGRVTATTAMGFVKKLSPEEQKKLAESISGQDKVSSKEVERYIADVKSKQIQIDSLKFENEQLNAVNKKLMKQVNQGPKVEKVEIEVTPDDYEEAKTKARQFEIDNKRLAKENADAVIKLKSAEAQKNEEIRRNTLSIAMSDLKAFKERFGHLDELASVIAEIGKLEERYETSNR